MTTQLLKAAAIASVLAISAAPAHAGFIEGEITMSADLALTGGTGGLADALGIDFIGDDFIVDGATGTFADMGIAQGDTGNYTDFDFNPLASELSDLWSIDEFSFTLTDVEIAFQNSYFLVLLGTGYISADGFFDTAGTWSLTANGFGSTFNFSSAAQVDEPAMLGLIGLGGLVAFGLRRRRSA